MPPAMQNLFAIGASSAPSRTSAGPSKQTPSSRFEDALEDARPKDVAAETAPPEPKSAGKSPEAKKTSSGNKPAGTSRPKRPTRRAAQGKDADAAETSAENTDPTAAADGQTPNATDDGPEKKTPGQQAGDKADDTQQSPILAAQATVATPVPVSVAQAKTNAKPEQEGTNAPQKAAIQPLQADGRKKQVATAGQTAKAAAGKPADGGAASRPDAAVAEQADA
ncbi:MAG TPA: hypothetical protein VG269_16715, partial [Tepidisphaeraceae bacterium]|nr:hypothetical protein [Tepidisphaeraceae bacterium]